MEIVVRGLGGGSLGEVDAGGERTGVVGVGVWGWGWGCCIGYLRHPVNVSQSLLAALSDWCATHLISFPYTLQDIVGCMSCMGWTEALLWTSGSWGGGLGPEIDCKSRLVPTAFLARVRCEN